MGAPLPDFFRFTLPIGMLLVVFTRAHAESPIRLVDVTAQTGIGFRHYDGSTGKQYLVEAVSAGLALFDYDSDGDVDVYFINGADIPPADGNGARNALYRNNGDWTFTDVTDEAGVGGQGFGLGVAAADYDNDGDQDLYVSNYGPNVLYRNNGDGTFTDVTAASGVANGNKVGAGVAFFDADRDGDLDLYVANYIQFSPGKQKPRTTAGFPMYPSPHDFEPEVDAFFRNNGDGTFVDDSIGSGIAAQAAAGMGIVAADYDNDGDIDVFVCNDAMANFLFQNDGSGKFTEFALVAGVAFDLNGGENGSMGVDCGDFDNDGLLDFFTTNFDAELPVLYQNTGGGFFHDATLLTGAGAGSRPHVNWGTGFVDFDNDGDRDLFIACGHLQDYIEKIDDRRAYEARNILLMNGGDGRFTNVSGQSGDGMNVKLSSRGTAFGDLDNDGDIDAIVVNSRCEPTILRNDSPNQNHWIQLRLRGTRGNRDGIGARVEVIAGELTQIAEVHSGRGYQSHHGMRLHFGLGSRDRIDRINVRWTDGRISRVESPSVDRLLSVVEPE